MALLRTRLRLESDLFVPQQNNPHNTVAESLLSVFKCALSHACKLCLSTSLKMWIRQWECGCT